MDKKELVSLLEKYKIDVSLFGKNKAKSLDDLLVEIRQGETVLVEKNEQLFRELSVARVNVFAKTKEDLRIQLIEDYQILNNGQIRRRKKKTSVSEKLKKGESPLSAMRRGLLEELGIRRFKFISKPSFDTEIVQSPSYPGVLSKYIFHDFAVILADDEYRGGYIEKTKNITTFFRWTTI